MGSINAIVYESEIMEMRRASFIIEDESRKLSIIDEYEEYDILDLSSNDFNEYIEALQNICQIDSWNNMYDNKNFSGEHWVIKLVYDDGGERRIEGFNSYPEEYNDFLDISNSYL